MQITVQPSQLNLSGLADGQWARGIPTPGVTANNPVPAVGGLATCRNLIRDSPPTLLERYQFYSYAIGFGVFLSIPSIQAGAEVSVEMALLVNDEVRYVTRQTEQPTLNTGISYLANGVFVGDLVNPIAVDARDRLGLRLGVMTNQATEGEVQVIVGGQVSPIYLFSGFESTLTYDTLQLPARRRL